MDSLRSRCLQHTISAFLLLCLLAANSAAAAKSDLVVQNEGPEARPDLIFASDRPTAELHALFTPELIRDLQQLKAGVALSTEDLSPERASVVRELNTAGIPMIAWLALPKSEGYYINADNASQTATFFAQFDAWTHANGLHWEALGLDIEPTLSEYGALMGHKGGLLRLMLRRGFDSGRAQRARAAYNTLIKQMQDRGYYVQTYQLQFLADERKAHTTLLERLFGIVDVKGNEEVFMLYSSFNHDVGAGLIWQYGPDAQTVAVGSTASSGDPKVDAKYAPLNWDEFSRDLIVARHFSKTVGIYSLEGCVRQGFMPKLKTLDWNERIVIPAKSVGKAAGFRKFVFLVLWVGSHIVYIVVAVLLAIAWLVRFIVFRRRRKRAMRLQTAAPALR
ncbi:MAG TPA: hypothetical protein VF447_11500 [Terriglobales bacterium]